MASLYMSSEPSLDLLITKSNAGPISSSSIRGVLLPDFLSNILQATNMKSELNFQINPVILESYDMYLITEIQKFCQPLNLKYFPLPLYLLAKQSMCLEN